MQQNLIIVVSLCAHNGSTYSKDPELTDFVNYNWTYTLKPTGVAGTSIDADEF